MDVWRVDREDIDARIAKDVEALEAAIASVSRNLITNGSPQPSTDTAPCFQSSGLDSMEAYATILYEDQWKESNPRSTAPGIMTNYTQDLLFSMERLSQNPYPLELVDPDAELPFTLDDDVATEIAGVTLEELKSAGSLFYVDREFHESYDH